jgi:hypothetical protein
VTWRLVRQVLLVSSVAALGALAIAPAVAFSADGGDTWTPAAGERVSFAYVTDGAGLVTAVNGGPVGSMTCATDAAVDHGELHLRT